MTKLFESLKTTIEDSLTDSLTDTRIDVYSVELNDIDFRGDCEVRFDWEGDLVVELSIGVEDLCGHIAPDDMKKYLIDNGHLEE